MYFQYKLQDDVCSTRQLIAESQAFIAQGGEDYTAAYSRGNKQQPVGPSLTNTDKYRQLLIKDTQLLPSIDKYCQVLTRTDLSQKARVKNDKCSSRGTSGVWGHQDV